MTDFRKCGMMIDIMETGEKIMNKIAERIARLRALMEERHIDAVLVPTSDYHESEYVGEHFACRKYITGFTGSAGTALITGSWAGVWTDGRYFVQAAAELKDTGVELMKMGQPGVLSLEDYLEQLPDGITLGFDGRVINGKMGEDLKERLEEKKITLDYHAALVDEIWEDRPPLSAEPFWKRSMQENLQKKRLPSFVRRWSSVGRIFILSLHWMILCGF